MEVFRNEITRSKDKNIFKAFYSFYQIAFQFTPTTSNGCIISFMVLVSLTVLKMYRYIANLRGEKLDLIVVLICITLIICECGQFLHICLLTMLLFVETRCLDFLSLSPSLSSRE